MKRLTILSIGRDSSVVETGSQLHERFVLYDSYHQFHHIVMNPGSRREVMIGGSIVVLTGGQSLPGAFFNALKEVWHRARVHQFSLITTQDVLYAGLVGYLVAKRSSLPLYVQVHGDHLDNERWFKSKVGKFNRFMNIIGKYILRQADAVRVVSNRLKQQLHQQYRIPEEKVTSIPIGTELSLFGNQPAAQRSRCILFAQRLIPEKQPMLFTEVVSDVLKALPATTVAIAGEGFQRAEMEAYFSERNLTDRVTFHGHTDRQKLATLYATSYCYLHTADWEGWGMPMIEAMASGCPVVTTDTGCAGEAITHEETGLVTSINDQEALIQETTRLFTDEELWQRLSNAGKAEAKKWSSLALAEKNMRWYATIDRD